MTLAAAVETIARSGSLVAGRAGGHRPTLPRAPHDFADSALLAREIGVRATVDIDIYREGDLSVSETDLREAARIDLQDWFTFQVGSPRPTGDAGVARRLPVTAMIGAAIWSSFHVDLASNLRMIGKPETVPALARLGIPSVKQTGYIAYPLVDHIADKVAAMYEVHGTSAAPSTRYRDLVDLVAISLVASLSAAPLTRAIRSEETRRGIQLPVRLAVLDVGLWSGGYAAEARRSLLPEARTLDEAMELEGRFLDPVLAGSARGSWHPGLRGWKAR